MYSTQDGTLTVRRLNNVLVVEAKAVGVGSMTLRWGFKPDEMMVTDVVSFEGVVLANTGLAPHIETTTLVPIIASGQSVHIPLSCPVLAPAIRKAQ